jgi:hypothetical protein
MSIEISMIPRCDDVNVYNELIDQESSSIEHPKPSHAMLLIIGRFNHSKALTVTVRKIFLGWFT